MLLAAVLPGTIFFTFIAKQQVYYTLPIFGPMVAWRYRNRLAWLAGRSLVFRCTGLGAVPEVHGCLKHGWHPATQHHPVTNSGHCMMTVALELQPDDQLLIFSEDPTLYEGFVVLKARALA